MRHRWFRPEEAAGDEGDEGADEGAWVEECRAILADAVGRRLPSNADVGLFLSGGLDSSIVAAELGRQCAAPPRTWAIHFGEPYPHELDFARQAADHTGTAHEEVLIRPRAFLPRLRQIVWHLDDPIGDPITVPNFELSQHAAQSVRWIFNGEGGDPLFGGPKNIPMLLGHWYGGLDDGPGFRERAYLASYRRAYDEVGRLLAPEIRDQIDPARDLEGVLTPFFDTTRPRSFLHKLIAINLRLKGAHLILPKVERMTAAAGLRPQAPLFDERLAELVFRVPGRMLLRGGTEKWILKRAYEGALPAPIVERPKSGMRVPVHFWFQGEMRRFARRTLGKRPLRRAGIFDPERVASLLAYAPTEGGPARYGLKLWMLLTFELWRQQVLEGQAP